MSEQMASSPERYIRIQIGKTATKGYTYETSVSLRWTDLSEYAPVQIKELLELADDRARAEIARREALDAKDNQR